MADPFGPRTEAQRQQDDITYAEGVKDHEQGYDDGYAGRPSVRTADHYLSGYDDGKEERHAEDNAELQDRFAHQDETRAGAVQEVAEEL